MLHCPSVLFFLLGGTAKQKWGFISAKGIRCHKRSLMWKHLNDFLALPVFLIPPPHHHHHLIMATLQPLHTFHNLIQGSNQSVYFKFNNCQIISPRAAFFLTQWNGQLASQACPYQYIIKWWLISSSSFQEENSYIAEMVWFWLYYLLWAWQFWSWN